MASLIHDVGHGFVAGDPVYFGNLVPSNCGIVEGQTYYVLASGLTADDFEFSDAAGGTPISLTFDITEGIVSPIPVYTAVTDPTHPLAPPVAPAAPGSVVLSSAVVVAPDGTAITRLDITVVQPAIATLRHTIVTITGGSNEAKVVIPVGQTTGSIASVVPGVVYTGTGIAYDTFGLASSATASATHTAVGDTSAPATPTGVQSSDGFRSWSVSWNANTEDDLDHYEIDWRVSGTPDYTGPIICYTTRFTYTPAFTSGTGTLYDVSIRAVDHTGNASAWTSVVNPIAYLLDGSDIYDGTITTTEIADGGITTPKLATNAVTADKIAANSISVGKMAQNPNNEAANGGFEVLSTAAPAVDTFGAVSVSPFLGWSTGDTVARVAYTKTNPHGGGIAALLKANTAALARYKTELLPVLGSRRYHFSWWYRGAAGNNAGAAVQAFVREYDVNGTQGFTTSFVVHTVGTSTTWAQETGTCVLNASTVAVDILVRNVGTAAGDIIGADDIEFYPADYDVNHAAGNVLIDSTGITINNGKLTFTDQYGAEAVGGYGFGPSWMQFIRRGLYNANLAAGSSSDIAVSETGSGSGLANYKASSSTGLPGWVVSASDGDVSIQTDATATGGKALRSLQTGASQTNRIYQDIPVNVGKTYFTRLNWRYTITGVTDFALNIYASYRDSDHAIIGSRVGSGLTYSATRAAYAIDNFVALVAATVAPANAVYLRIEYEVVHNAYTAATKLSTVFISDAEVREHDGGFAYTAAHPSVNNVTDFSTSPITLATSAAGLAGACAQPIWVPARMVVSSILFWGTDASLAHSAEAGIYRDDGTNVLQRVPGSDVAYSWTPTVAAARSGATSGSPVLEPGLYWVVLRNVGTARGFAVGGTANGATPLITGSVSTTAASNAALGATYDISGMAASGRVLGIAIKGLVFGAFIL